MSVQSGVSRTATYALAAVIVVGLGMALWAAASQPERIAANLLVVSYGLLGLGLGAAVLLALLCVTGARWSDVILPVARRLTLLVPVGGVSVWIVLLACPGLYPWTAATAEPASAFQEVWLSRPFFLLRATVYLGLWLGFVLALVRSAAARDRTARVRIAASFLVVFALTCWLASVDWIMSLEPAWSSAVFGIYHFAGMFLGALAMIIVLVVCLDQRGAFAGRLTRYHRGDLGTLLFAFSSFWMYLWFCQYLLIWFVNNPEETQYYLVRQHDPWPALLLASLTFNWGVPFLVLLLRPAKENGLVLVSVAAGVLVGRWLDLYLMVLPPVTGAAVLADAGLFMSAVALALLLLARVARLDVAVGTAGEVS